MALSKTHAADRKLAGIVSSRKARSRNRGNDRQPGAATDQRQADDVKAKDDRSVLEIAAEWVSQNMLWALGLTPFALAALQILIVARGDPATLRVLVQNADPVKVILGSILPLIPMAFLMLGPYYIERRIRKERVPKWWGATSIVITILAVFTLPSAWFSVLTFGYLMMIFVAYEWHLRRTGRKSVRVYSFNSVLILVAVAAGISGPWMSAEVIRVQNEGPIIAYIVADSEGWATLLRYGGGVKIVPSNHIESRKVCNVRIRGQSMIGRILNWPVGNPLCDELVVETQQGIEEQAPTVPRPEPVIPSTTQPSTVPSVSTAPPPVATTTVAPSQDSASPKPE